ncbi:MAG TPA: hypothetical protein VGK79_01795 [Gaiellaceae bacterium]
MTFLTPLAGLAALALVLPLAAALLGGRRVDAVRRTLRLPAPDRRALVVEPALAAAGVALLGLAAAQPALTRSSTVRVQRGVQAMFVLDTSRSMAAAASPRAATRLDRAVAAAVALRDGVPGIEAGVSALTDRVLPDLLPVADRAGFTAVVRRSVAIEAPPPQHGSVRATDYGALAGLATGNAFAPTATRRIVVLLTDGESVAVPGGELARALPADRGYRFVAVQLWRADESVYKADGTPEAAYRPDPSSRATLHDLAAALGGQSFDEGHVTQARDYLQRLGGNGPTVATPGTQRSRIALAPYVALLALLVLLASFAVSVSAERGLRWIGR